MGRLTTSQNNKKRKKKDYLFGTPMWKEKEVSDARYTHFRMIQMSYPQMTNDLMSSIDFSPKMERVQHGNMGRMQICNTHILYLKFHSLQCYSLDT